MSVKVNPPPLQVPGSFFKEGLPLSGGKEIGGFLQAFIQTVYKLWNEVFSLRFHETTYTTDNTVTPLQRVDVGTNKSVLIEARVIARRTGGSAGTAGDTAWYVLQGGFKNISGTVSLIASSILNGGEDQAGWNLAFAISGTQVVVVGTGATNNNITWESWVSFYEVGV